MHSLCSGGVCVILVFWHEPRARVVFYLQRMSNERRSSTRNSCNISSSNRKSYEVAPSLRPERKRFACAEAKPIGADAPSNIRVPQVPETICIDDFIWCSCDRCRPYWDDT